MSTEEFSAKADAGVVGSAPQVTPAAAQDGEIDDEDLAGVAGGSLFTRLLHTGEKTMNEIKKRV